MSALHQRLHLTSGGQFLAINSRTRAEETFDLFSEVRADRSTPAGDILARHLDKGGMVTSDTFGNPQGLETFSAPQMDMLEERAKQLPGRNEVDFSRVLRFVVSTDKVNWSRIVVPNDAWSTTALDSNPIGPYGHHTEGPPELAGIGRWLFVGNRTQSPKSTLIGFAEFARHETNPTATTVLNLYLDGIFNAVSPGFQIGVVDFDEESDIIVFGSRKEPNEIVEVSFVPVPRNSDALRFAVASDDVALKQLRGLISLQIEAAYSDPMQMIETARLEKFAAVLGIERQQFVEMPIEAISELGLPAADTVAAVTDEQIANALRTRDRAGLEVDEDAWGRFMLAGEGVEDDQSLGLVALGAGLTSESQALGRLALSVVEVEAEDVAGEPEAAENAADGIAAAEVEEKEGLSAEQFKGLFLAALGPVAESTENQTGKLVIPLDPVQEAQ